MALKQQKVNGQSTECPDKSFTRQSSGIPQPQLIKNTKFNEMEYLAENMHISIKDHNYYAVYHENGHFYILKALKNAKREDLNEIFYEVCSNF